MLSVLCDRLAVRIAGVSGRVRPAQPTRQSRTLPSENASRFRPHGDAELDALTFAVLEAPDKMAGERRQRDPPPVGDLAKCHATRALRVHRRGRGVQLPREQPRRPAVMKDVEKDVLGEMALRQQPQRAVAEQCHALLVSSATPRRHELVGKRLDVKAAPNREVGEGVVIVVEVGLQLTSAEPKRALEHLFVERNPVVCDPVLLG